MGPWTKEIVNGEGGGLLGITEVVNDAWKQRKELYREKEPFMGGNRIWGDMEEELKDNWVQVWKENQEEGNLVFSG